MDLTAPPNWEALEIGADVTTLRIANGNDELEQYEDSVANLALIIGSHPNISSIVFTRCSKAIEHCGMAASCNQLVSLNLSECYIGLLKASILKDLLTNGRITKLWLQYCEITESAAEVLKAALCDITSIKKFVWFKGHGASITDGVLGMQNSNTSLRHLEIGISDESIVPLCEAASWNAKLGDFKICNRTMGLDCVAATAMLMRANTALKKLTFDHCMFSQRNMDILLNRLSKGMIFESLKFAHVTINGASISQPELSWAAVKVKSLECDHMTHDLAYFSSMMDAIAANPHINSFASLSGTLATDERLEKLCQAFLEPSRGPSELIIDGVGRNGAMISTALQHNTSVTYLVIADLELPSLVAIAEGLAHLHTLCTLQIGLRTTTSQEYSLAFFAALLRSVEQNTTLNHLVLCGMDASATQAKPYLTKIEYLLALNGVGNNSLLTLDVPLGIWPHVLASNPVWANQSLAYFFLTNKPDMINSCRRNPDAVASRGRKRRTCE